MGSVTAAQCTMMSFFIIFPMAVLNLFCKSWMRTADEIIFPMFTENREKFHREKHPLVCFSVLVLWDCSNDWRYAEPVSV